MKVTGQLFRSRFPPSTPGDGTRVLGLDGRHLPDEPPQRPDLQLLFTLFICLFGVQGAHMSRYKCWHHRTLGVSSVLHHVDAGARTRILRLEAVASYPVSHPPRPQAAVLMDGVAPWQEATAESLFLQGSDPIPMCHSVQGLLIHRDSDASNYPGNLAFSGQTTGESFYLTRSRGPDVRWAFREHS